MSEFLGNLGASVKNRIINDLDFSKDISDEEMLEIIDRALSEQARRLAIPIEKRKALRRQIFYSIRKLDVLQAMVDDPDITEIMINGMDNIFIEKNGVIERHPSRFESKEKLEDVVQQIVASCNRVMDRE